MTTDAEPLRAVDTNVLLRYLLNDVLAQAEKARRLIDSDQLLGITAVTLAEVAWVLTGSVYKRERAAVATQLIHLLARENLITVGLDKTEAQIALLACTPDIGAAGFGDALIAACARSEGVQEIFSFDQRFARAGLTPLSPP